MSQFLDELRKVFGPGTNRIGDVGGASDSEQLCSCPAEVYYIAFNVSAVEPASNFILRDGTATGDDSFTDIFTFSMSTVGVHTFDYSAHPLRFEKGISLQFSASGSALFQSQVQWSPVGNPTPFG